MFLGDASYCTPEQYKDCAEPALGKSEHTHNFGNISQGHTLYFLVYISLFSLPRIRINFFPVDTEL